MKQVRDLPHDLLAEKSIVSCLILDSSVFDEISDLDIERDDFYDPRFGIIYDAIKDLAINRKPIDYVTLCSRLNERGNLEEIGGESFILEIVEDQVSPANAYHYAKIVKDKSSIRQIVRTAHTVAERGLSYSGETQDYINEVEGSFFSLTNKAKTGGMSKLNDCLKHNLKELEDDSRNNGEISGLPTGYPHLDEQLLGMQPGQLIVLAARPAMGKTAFALNLALNACKLTQLPVAIFSLEMMSQELSMRLLSCKAKVDSKRIKKKAFLDTDLRNIGTAVQELSSYPVFINDNGNATIFDIQSQCRKIKTEQGLGMIIIDYLQLMKSHTGNPSREQQISEMSRGLKSMAKELECPILALSQLNRGVEQRPNKRPMVSDLRESGAIEQDADVVMFIYRDEVYNPETKDKGVAEIIIGKNRHGETGTTKLAFVGAYTSFENLAFEQSGPNQ